MSNNPKLSTRALIIGSGPDNPKAGDLISDLLDGFIYEEIETQRIDLGGRTIIGILIALDPAHFDAIRNELENASLSNVLDVAMLEVGPGN